MPTIQKKSLRNQSMECAKLILSILVVLIHMELPGRGNEILGPVAVIAVPMFFAISGYFSFGAGCNTLARRLMHIARLTLIADFVNLICYSFLIELDGGSTIAYWRAAVPDWDEIILWLTVQHDSYLAQLWTMISTMICYGMLWVYVRFFEEEPVNYKPLYIVSSVLFQFYVAMAIVLPAAGVSISYLASRNAWFYGIPCFVLGIFLHEYQERIFRAYHLTTRKLGVMLVVCLTLLFLGVAIILPMEIIVLMLFLLSAPELPVRSPVVQKMVPKFGFWSTGIYIFHVTMLWMYEGIFQEALIGRFGQGEIWLRPVFVVGLSFLSAVIWERVEWMLKQWKRRKAS